jgi:hypothetical protein
MYRDLKATYWWYGMNIDVTEDVDLFTTPVRGSRPSINDPLGCCNLCEYPSGSRKKLLWILLWDCLGLSLDIIPIG